MLRHSMRREIRSESPARTALIIRQSLYQDREWVEYLCDRIPLKRPGCPNDLDGAVVFLASEASRYITRQTLLVDGGISTGATRATVAR